MNPDFVMPDKTLLNQWLAKHAGIAGALATRNRPAFVIKVMAYSEIRELNKTHPWTKIIEDEICHRLNVRDWLFFVRLGRALDEPALSFWQTPKNDRLSAFLLAGWNNSINPNNQPLSNMSDTVVLEVATLVLEDHDLTFDQVRKARQRLGLIRTSRPKLKKFRNDGNGKFTIS